MLLQFAGSIQFRGVCFLLAKRFVFYFVFFALVWSVGTKLEPLRGAFAYISQLFASLCLISLYNCVVKFSWDLKKFMSILRMDCL